MLTSNEQKTQITDPQNHQNEQVTLKNRHHVKREDKNNIMIEVNEFLHQHTAFSF